MSTRSYAAATLAQASRAANVALRSMGFTIVDESNGRIKTAPKVVVVNAYGGNYSAVAVESSIAWTVDVSSGSGGGAVIHADLRPSQAGHPIAPTEMDASYANTSYKDLFHEIESNLGGAPGQRVQPTSTTAAVVPKNASIAAATPAVASDASNPPASTRSSSAAGVEPTDADLGLPRTEGVSLAALLGYGFNDALQVGLGARGGYTLANRVYLGGMFMYHLGSSQTSSVAGVSVTTHVNVYYLGPEGGYDFTAGPVTIRPYGGLGPAWASASVTTNSPSPFVATGANSASSGSRFGFWFGGAVLYPVSRNFSVGGDARVLVVSDYNTFNLAGTGAYRF